MKRPGRLMLSLGLLSSVAASTVLPLSESLILPLYANDSDEAQVIHASDFGADPTGTKDSTQAIQKALAAAKELRETSGKPVTVSFEKGEYQIYRDFAATREIHTSNTSSTDYPTKTIGILIEDQQDLTLEGNGSLFMMHGNMMALAVTHSKNITLHDFSWDFAVPTTSEMTVSRMYSENGKDVTEFYVPKCFPYQIDGTTFRWTSEPSPYTGKTYWTKTGIHENTYAISATDATGEFTRRFGTNAENPFNNVTSITPVEGTDGTILKFVYNSSRPSMQKVGMTLQFNSAAVRETAGALIWESENVTARKVHVHYMHGFGWLLQMAKDVYFYECSMEPRANSGHIVASYADGIHASGAAGKLVIENCRFAALHDDPINIHGTFTRVEQKLDDHRLQLKYIHAQQGGFPQFHVGDQVQFFSRDLLQSADNETVYTVKNVISNPGEDGNDLKTMVIEFDEELPSYLTDKIGSEPKYVAENITYTPEVTIRNNTFRDLAARAILCTTRKKTLIENNTFYNTSMATIFLSNDSDQWYESGPIRDMTIRNNTFYIKDSGERGWEYRSAIYIHPVTKNGGLPGYENPIHKNITIEGNTFHMDSDTVVKAESVENLTIRNNTILRTNPDLAFTIGDLSKHIRLAAGASTQSSVTLSGSSRTGNTENMYEFAKSKNVVIDSNTYDNGQKLYAYRDNTPEDQIHITNDAVTLTTSKTGAASASAGAIHYLSADPAIASVDDSGNITGVSAGTTQVYAWTKWDHSLLYSDPIEVTISESTTGSAVTIDQKDNTVVGAASNFTAKTPEGETVTWSVTALDGTATDQASITSAGELNAQSGIYKVIASSASGSDSRIVLVNTGKSASLTPGISVTNSNTNLTLNETEATIALEKGDLYEENNSVKNLILYDIPADTENFATSVHVTGLPIRESGQWDTASFLVFGDADNYLSLGKKCHYDGIATVSETGGSATELGDNAAQNALSDAWLAFVKEGNTVHTYWSADGKTYTSVRDLSATMLTGKSVRIGFAGWHTNPRGKTVTFKDFRFKANTTTLSDLNEETSVSFEHGNAATPVLSNVQLSAETAEAGSPVSVSYDATNPDGGQSSAQVLWTLKNDEGKILSQTLCDSTTYTPAQPGKLTATVYLTSAWGIPAEPKATAECSVTTPASSSIRSIQVNGQTVWTASGTAPDSASIALPAIGEKAEIRVEGAASGWKLDGTAQTTASAVLSLSGKTEWTIANADGSTPVTLNIEQAKDSRCAIKDLKVNDEAFSANSVMTWTGSNTMTISAASDDTASLSLYSALNPAALAMAQAGQTLSASVTLKTGMNSFIVGSHAEDGINLDKKLVHILYAPDTTAQVTSVKLGDAVLSKEEPNVVSDESTAVLSAAYMGAGRQAYLNGKELAFDAQGHSLLGEIKPGVNELIVKVLAADGISRAVERYTLYASDPANADLYALSVDGKTVSDPMAETYAQTISKSNFEVRAQAMDPDATVILDDGVSRIIGTGSASLNVSLFENSHQVKVFVLSKDGTESHSSTMDFEMAAYLSDLTWSENSTVGYDTIQKDKASSGAAITLCDEEQNGRKYEKGIGSHVNTNIIFNIPANTYSALRGAVGVDYTKHNSIYANITFKILTGSKEAFNSGSMTGTTPLKEFSVPLDGVTQITLNATQPSNNWDGHADFADCKLEMTMPQMQATNLDLTMLTAEIETFPNVRLDSVDAAKKAAWITAIETGSALKKDVLSNAQNTVTQLQIDNAAAAIRNARLAMLGETPAVLDYTQLNLLIKTAETIDLNEVTDASKGTFAQDLASAKALVNKALDQAHINAQAKALHASLLALRFTPDSKKLDGLK
ncbi:NPCBM/NEW2 domain-containing protein [uncultured Allobaculum sp.]|uniref:NPCBM/NEW2 domain-containing protein n=1 Tax=uncultured Allobaculum sp. TaxID=1187017 RepID=UPI0025969A37|nr:NPCBM/NEW2 domain-containing protein [uncultured Allobaculum sp.]